MTDFDILYQSNRQMVYSICILYLKVPADAEDVTQDVFLTYLEKSPHFKSKEHGKAWLLKCAKNACISRLRRNTRRQDKPEEDMDKYPDRGSTEGVVTSLDLVQKLPELYREVLYLKCVSELDDKSIARILHRNESTVRNQIARGRKMLSELYYKKGGDV